MQELLEEFSREMAQFLSRVEVLVPHAKYDVVAWMHRIGEVLYEEHTGEGVCMEVLVPPKVKEYVESYENNSRECVDGRK